MTHAAPDIRPLRPKDALLFRNMTFPAYRHLLDLDPAVRHLDEGPQRMIEPLAVGAWRDQQPIGLVLAERPSEEPAPAELLSLFVNPESRRQGVASALLAAVEAAARDDGRPRLRAVYMTGKQGAAIFEHMIAGRGWTPPVSRMITLKATVEQARSMPWFQTYRLRAGFEIMPWRALTETDRADLRATQEAEGWIPEDLEPWRFDQRGYDGASSVAAKLDGKVVGWVINHRINPQTIRFTCSFMHPDLAKRGRIVPLYSESIRRLEDTPVERCIFTTPMHFPAMVQFVMKRIAPWATAVTETRGASKVFQAA